MGSLKELDWGAASPACPGAVLHGLLFYQQSIPLKVLDDCSLRLLDFQALIFACQFGHQPVLVYALLDCQLVLVNPFQILLVPDGTNHDDASAELGVDLRVRDYLDLPAVNWSYQLLSDKVLLRLVLGADGDHLAGAYQLGPSSGYQNILIQILDSEMNVIQVGLFVLVFDLRVCKGGAASRTPVDGGQSLVNQPPLVKLDERNLSQPAVIFCIGAVENGGVHGVAQQFELVCYQLNIVIRELGAQLDELLPGVVAHLDVVLPLDVDLDGHSVDIYAERKHDIESALALVPGREIDMSIMDGMPDMQRPRGIPGGIVDAVHWRVGILVKMIELLLLPCVLPLFFDYLSVVICHCITCWLFQSYN